MYPIPLFLLLQPKCQLYHLLLLQVFSTQEASSLPVFPIDVVIDPAVPEALLGGWLYIEEIFHDGMSFLWNQTHMPNNLDSHL